VRPATVEGLRRVLRTEPGSLGQAVKAQYDIWLPRSSSKKWGDPLARNLNFAMNFLRPVRCPNLVDHSEARTFLNLERIRRDAVYAFSWSADGAMTANGRMAIFGQPLGGSKNSTIRQIERGITNFQQKKPWPLPCYLVPGTLGPTRGCTFDWDISTKGTKSPED
jgi:hypothetical protein